MVKRIAALALFLLVGCSSMSRFENVALADRPYDDRLTIAIVDFQNRSGDAGYDAVMAGMTGAFINDLNETKQFRLIERERLSSVIDELSLSVSGLTDPETAREVGKVLGVDALLFANLSSVTYSTNKQTIFIAWTEGQKTEVTLDARLVRTETGEILATGQSSAFVKSRNWVAFGFARLGRKTDRVSTIQQALEIARRQLAWTIAGDAP
jgi:curli biogenesis system outer membrane secretion channel CsgG